MTNSLTFMICVAGLNIMVTTKYPSIKDSFFYFLSDAKTADFSIAVDDELFQFAEQMQRELAPEASKQQIESIALQYALCQAAILHDCIVIHASSIQKDGAAYIFAAPSNTGKSTHSRMWREVFGDRVSMINDDMPLLRRLEGTWYVCGTPWNGKHGLGFNCMVPLRAVSLLSRGENSVRPFQDEDWPYLLNQFLRPYEAKLMNCTLDLLELLLKEIPVYHMFCTPTHQAAIMAENNMKKDYKYED